MLELTSGDILQADTEALVNTVNCVGVMGKGLALQFKKAFPANFEEYEDACEAGEVELGKMFVHETGQLTNPKYIINFPTKDHWRSDSRLEDIEEGMDALVAVVERLGIKSIAIPPLGCGLGGLDWEDVRECVFTAFEDVSDVEVLLYQPGGAPEADDMVMHSEQPKWTAGRAILIALMDEYLAGLMDPSISLLELHKLMYFAQEGGENLRLQFEKGHYGPYATNLRHVLNRIEGHFITGFGDGGEKPDKPLELVEGVREKAHDELDDLPGTQNRFEQVADLVDGFETPFGMELLATVHWVASQESAENLEDVVNGVRSWNTAKKKFSPREIEIAWEHLKERGWL